jgi:hypothetical protein
MFDRPVFLPEAAEALAAALDQLAARKALALHDALTALHFNRIVISDDN